MSKSLINKLFFGSLIGLVGGLIPLAVPVAWPSRTTSS